MVRLSKTYIQNHPPWESEPFHKTLVCTWSNIREINFIVSADPFDLPRFFSDTPRRTRGKQVKALPKSSAAETGKSSLTQQTATRDTRVGRHRRWKCDRYMIKWEIALTEWKLVGQRREGAVSGFFCFFLWNSLSCMEACNFILERVSASARCCLSWFWVFLFCIHGECFTSCD